jgi:hypothetical protein
MAATRAGRLAYRSGDYEAARSFFTAAATHGSLAPETAAMLDVSARILGLDPSARGLGTRRRVQRVRNALAVAESRLARCQRRAPVDGDTAARLNNLSTRLQAADKVRRPVLERNPDRRDLMMALVSEIEALPDNQCGSASIDDRALQLIAERRQPAAR